MPLPSPSDWTTFYESIRKKTALDLNLYKQDQLQRRIISIYTAKSFKTLADFGPFVISNEENVVWFLDKIAINVSELFRNPEKWAEVEAKVLPELLKTNKKLKCWSAGCSYGAEAHTLACILEATYPGGHSVFGSDIDQASLTQARSGLFSDNDMRGVPKKYTRFFSKQGLQWLADTSLKKYLTFKTGDLLSARFETGFDLIMCRNVVIYFNDDTKDKLYEAFTRALRPGGYLFVGGTERVAQHKELGLENPFPFFYRKPLNQPKITGALSWQNAS